MKQKIKQTIFLFLFLPYLGVSIAFYYLSIPLMQFFVRLTVAKALSEVLRYRASVNYLFNQQSCLFQSLFMQILYAKSGIETELKVGIQLKDKFKAHAWLEESGRIVYNKGPALDQYKSLHSGDLFVTRHP